MTSEAWILARLAWSIAPTISQFRQVLKCLTSILLSLSSESILVWLNGTRQADACDWATSFHYAFLMVQGPLHPCRQGLHTVCRCTVSNEARGRDAPRSR